MGLSPYTIKTFEGVQVRKSNAEATSCWGPVIKEVVWRIGCHCRQGTNVCSQIPASVSHQYIQNTSLWKLDTVSPLVQKSPNANATTFNDIYLIHDICDTMSTLSHWIDNFMKMSIHSDKYSLVKWFSRQIKEDDILQSIRAAPDKVVGSSKNSIFPSWGNSDF